MARAVWSRGFHVAVLAAGLAFLLIDAFHGTLWFDESYSVALASHSFADIWRIDAFDVHPPLYYFALHALYLVFGSNILAFRLFSVAGAFALGLLGLTHVRRDFGWKAGLLFTFFVLFTPYLVHMSVQIRMYSWAAFSVAACGVYACRIACAAADALRAGGRPAVPAHWWALFFAASLASAYLHYYGMIAAFALNVGLLAVLARTRCAGRGRLVAVLLAGAVVQVALYVPWLAMLLGQVAERSGGRFWISFTFPVSLLQLIGYPLVTEQAAEVVTGSAVGGGVAAFAASCALVAGFVAFAVLAVVACMRAFGRRAEAKAAPAEGRLATHAPGVFKACFALYLGVILIAALVSVAMGTVVLYYRYLGLVLPAVLLAVALALSRVRSRELVAASCAVLLATACVAQALETWAATDGCNDAALAAVEELAGSSGEGSLPVLGSEIGLMGVLATDPSTSSDLNIYYLAWQDGSYWSEGYEAYDAALEPVFDQNDTPLGEDGRAVYVCDSDAAGSSGALETFVAATGAEIVDLHVVGRPYEADYFVVALVDLDGAGGSADGEGGAAR